MRHAGPAILASNATVVLALLTLLLAVVPSTRSLGAQAACGLVVAALFVLCALPPLLGAVRHPAVLAVHPPPRASTPPRNAGGWYRVADWVSNHAGRVAVGAGPAGGAVHRAAGHADRAVADRAVPGEAESVSAYDTLAAHFPSG